jgi:hypothetical protein
MFFCLLIALYFHYSKVIKNHCKVWEFWPSISATIGDYKPEMNIWRITIALVSGPRFIISFLNYQFLSDSLIENKYFILLKIGIFIDIIRIFAAGGWTYISSSEYLLYHDICFVLYISFSFLWFFIHTSLFKITKIHPIMKNQQNYNMISLENKRIIKSYNIKWWCFLIQFITFIISVYIYIVEHNLKCTAGAYSFYSLLEWLLAICNICYDTSSYLDFQKYNLSINYEEEPKKN